MNQFKNEGETANFRLQKFQLCRYLKWRIKTTQQQGKIWALFLLSVTSGFQFYPEIASLLWETFLTSSDYDCKHSRYLDVTIVTKIIRKVQKQLSMQVYLQVFWEVN